MSSLRSAVAKLTSKLHRVAMSVTRKRRFYKRALALRGKLHLEIDIAQSRGRTP